MKNDVFRLGSAKMALALLLAFPPSLIPHPSFAIEVDGIAARVGECTILRSDVCNELRRMGETGESRYAEALDQLIDRQLILKAAAEAKVTMQEWVVENRVREIVNRAFDGDRNKLIEALGQQKVSYPEWYARTKDDLIVGAMRWNVIDKNVAASPQAMKREYEENREKYVAEHKVSVTVILLKPEEASRRNEILESLKDRTFEDLGGRRYVDVNPAETFQPAVAKEISLLKKGAVSGWVEIDGWSFLLRKDGEKVGKQLTFEEAYDQVEETVKEAEAKRLYTEWIARLRTEAYIRVF